jgi:hypothetical protein
LARIQINRNNREFFNNSSDILPAAVDFQVELLGWMDAETLYSKPKLNIGYQDNYVAQPHELLTLDLLPEFLLFYANSTI